MQVRPRIKFALQAALLHFLISLSIAAIAGFLVFYLWFPYPYRELAGGSSLFWLVVCVDVACGPLLTAVLYTPIKPRRELVQDLGLIALIQLAALAYGLHTLWQARPVYLAFEVDRLHLVTYADIQKEDLKTKKNHLYILPWRGIQLIGTREPVSNDEMMQSLDLSLQGIDPAFRPDWWTSYESIIPKVISKAYPMDLLLKKNPEDAGKINKAVMESGQPIGNLAWLPVISYRATDWIVLINKESAQPVAFAHVDGF
ncbi:TfpX/TfpZ family type IV pilin accessory protein [Delftia sp. CH05]|uniref:TfpX/TfpZ family type IV pilin accessory protein n=1 Tax=Delftia sp. CH05 TaxID=2692194 RepID=UPI00135DECA3|nr:TfpX/TfpZ family type IV pilin accessory protein [Delftia sp. CH05]MXN30603.1 hypothetical protein [Delftia sp. CH05]